MRICRFEHQGRILAGLYEDDHVVPLNDSEDTCVLEFLPGGSRFEEATQFRSEEKLSMSDIRLLVPNPRPNKLFLLAGNYAKHIEEGGEIAAERAETFPYVFMKPPTTTLTNPGDSVRIPGVSPNHIDWELELGIVIGKEAKELLKLMHCHILQASRSSTTFRTVSSAPTLIEKSGPKINSLTGCTESGTTPPVQAVHASRLPTRWSTHKTWQCSCASTESCFRTHQPHNKYSR